MFNFTTYIGQRRRLRNGITNISSNKRRKSKMEAPDDVVQVPTRQAEVVSGQACLCYDLVGEQTTPICPQFQKM